MSLFHYTDAAAVLSIIRNKKIWLTDIRFMNDSDEALDGARYIEKEIQGLIKSGDVVTDQALFHLQDFTIETVNEWLAEQHAFIGSFSTIEDHLVQWRSYGNYAVEFHETLKEDLAPVLVCIYNIETKLQLAKNLVADAREAITEELMKYDDVDGYKIAKALWSLGDAVNLFKHPSFIEENEMRICRLESAHSKLIKYRVRGGIVVPYLEVGFESHHVKAVHIGPMKNQDLAVASMRLFINNFEMENENRDPWNDFRIKVHPSLIPYREL
ncbi:DUF2971 domain-containing protein [Pseudomonas sp. GR 6-02]|uniref:DUF2971 domain-containing protein n=1 Tax=Pseudomonas sp. GR 6-02 TaxID=1659194 RepID=UPI0007E48AA9|nr:DUF2971 domain-containing protein [Pseudomonas sp. GR 6-02]